MLLPMKLPTKGAISTYTTRTYSKEQTDIAAKKIKIQWHSTAHTLQEIENSSLCLSITVISN